MGNEPLRKAIGAGCIKLLSETEIFVATAVATAFPLTDAAKPVALFLTGSFFFVDACGAARFSVGAGEIFSLEVLDASNVAFAPDSWDAAERLAIGALLLSAFAFGRAADFPASLVRDCTGCFAVAFATAAGEARAFGLASRFEPDLEPFLERLCRSELVTPALGFSNCLRPACRPAFAALDGDLAVTAFAAVAFER